MSLGANALVTWDEVTAVLKPPDGDVAAVEAIVDGVSEYFNSRTHRVLKTAVYTALYLDGNGSQILWLPNAPVTVPITSLALGSPTPLSLVVTTDYYLDSTRGRLLKVSGVWTLGVHNILITYTAGYAAGSVPKDLRWACLKQSDHEYQLWRTKSYGELSRSQGSESVSVSEEHLVPGIKDVLALYVREPS
jgi:hypothetical protein